MLVPLLVGCSGGNNKNVYEQITPAEAKALMDSREGYVILDVRTPEEFANGHIDIFLDEVGNHLNDGGIVQMIQSSFSDNDLTLSRLDELGFIAEIKAKEHFFFEDITLINAYKI